MTVSSLTRLGTANAYETVVQNLEQRQSTLSNLQNELSSGSRLVTTSDDPTATAASERALTRISRIAADQRAIDAENASITSAEGTLGSITSALQQFRQLVVNAGDAMQTQQDRSTIASQLSALRDQIFSLANAQDSNGKPLFAALGSALTPFVAPANGSQNYTFQGLPGQPTSSGVSIASALDGNAAFMNQPALDATYNATVSNSVTGSIPSTRTLTTGNVSVTNAALVNGSSYSIAVTGVDSTTVPGTTTVTYNVTESPNVGGPYNGITASFPSNQSGSFTVSAMPGLSLTVNGTPAVGDTINVAPNTSLFSTLDHAIKDIAAAGNNNAATQAVSQALNNLDIGMSKVSAVRGQAGALMNLATSITNQNSNQTTQQQTNESNASNVDMIQTISDFQNQQTGFQAALQSYAQIQKLSLFNFINN